MKPILVVIDIQNEYVTKGRPFFLETISSSLENAKSILAYARQNDWPVAHVRHLQAGEIFNPESEHSQFVAGFEPRANEQVFIKGNYSSYSSPEFAEYMQANSGAEIIVIGYGSTMCCLSTIIEGYHRGQRMTFIRDASCAKRSDRFGEQEQHQHATDILSRFSNVISTAELASRAR